MKKRAISVAAIFITIIATVCLCLFCLTSSATNDGAFDCLNKFRQSKVSNVNTNAETLMIFGTWNLDRIVMSSNNYTGEKNWGNGHVFREEWYVGYEVEYTSEYFRLGQQTFFSPVYEVYELSLYNYNNNGDFMQPDLFSFAETGDIIINSVERYENMADIQLTYFLITFEEDNFIPVGDQCVLLDNDTMLVGMWGNIILAHRIE